MKINTDKMNTFNLKETSEKTGVKRATIYRFYDKNPLLKCETKIVNRKKVIPEHHLPLIAKNNIYTKALKLENQNEQLIRLVDLLSDNVRYPLQYTLYQKQWSWYGTVAFKVDRGKKFCYHQMSQLFDHLNNLFGKIGLRIFFTLEPFNWRDGMHVHFILNVRNTSKQAEVINELNNYFKGNRVYLEPYDKYQAGIYYISKMGFQNEDWDILGDYTK